VERIKRYIIDGDVMQVVPSPADERALQRATAGSVPRPALPNPSPYMYYLDLGDFHVVGSSPEILVRLEEDEVTVRPIAGTRPAGHARTRIGRWKKSWSDPKEIGPST
jgi:anthranilate synthase component I